MSTLKENMAKDEEANLESISIEISNMLDSRSDPPSQKFSIFRVPDQLRHVNPDAYEPQVIGIGPYYYNNTKISHMEEHKKEYLRSLLKRTHQLDASKYVKAMKNLEKEAKEFYQVYNDLEDSEIWKDNNFVKMLVLDGCFLIELIRKKENEELRNENDPIFLVDLNEKSILRDILLIENQLPLFVLSKLYEETTSPGEKNFKNLLNDFIFDINPLAIVAFRTPTIEESKHLLDFTHNMWRPPLKETNSFWVNSVPSATVLRQAGINFKQALRNMFDLRFENGNLEIPVIHISYQTESLIPNLIAYEQVALNNDQTCYVADYSFMMRWLISSSQDAKFISDMKLVKNNLGDEVILSELFEKLVKNATPSLSHFFYFDLQRNLNYYRRRRRTAVVAKWKLWREKLWQEYFSSPWALISFLAACVLLILTLVQTYCSVKSVYP